MRPGAIHSVVRLVVVTNQAGVARGMINSDKLGVVHRLMVDELARLGVQVETVVVCLDHRLDASYRGKLASGMLIEAASLVNTTLEMLTVVRDDPRYLQAASRTGCGFVYVTDAPEDIRFQRSRLLRVAVNSLTQAVGPIRAFYRRSGP